MLTGILALLGAIYTIVLVHEAGHWIAARRAGMPVSVFSIGFGPRLAGFRWRETDVCLSLVPLGGYVRIDPMEERAEGSQENGTRFDLWPWHQRVGVIAAGVVMNLVLAAVIYLILPLGAGIRPAPPLHIAEVHADRLPAGTGAWAGNVAGSRVMAVDGATMATWSELVLAVVGTADGSIELELEGGVRRSLPVPVDENARMSLLGALERPVANGPRTRVGPAEAVRRAAAELRAAGTLIAESWSMLAEGRLSVRQLSGPFGIAEAGARIFQGGWDPFLRFVAFLSLNVAVMNLLPIPGLDGGHLAFIVVEAARRRPLSAPVQAYLGRVGLIWLSLVMMGTVVNDILRMLSR